MKNLLMVVALALTLTGQAQERKTRTEGAKIERMSTDQKRVLQVKKMTLELDLTATQQKEISALLTEQSNNRAKMLSSRKENKATDKKQRTAAERFEQQNQMLDNQIVMKERMKKILSNEQFKKWDSSRTERQERAGKKLAFQHERKANKTQHQRR